MSITNYSELKAAVGNWLNRSDLTSYISDFIAMAESTIYRRLRIRAMEASLNSTIASGVIAVPADYLELKHAYIDGTPTTQLQRKSAQWIYENYPLRSADGMPLYIATDGDNFIFGRYPDSYYTIKGTYYKKLSALSDSNTTNWFIINAPDLLLFGSLKEAEPFLKNDDRMMLWESKFEKIISAIEQGERKERLSGSSISGTASNR
jgi:hypothetical protein